MQDSVAWCTPQSRFQPSSGWRSMMESIREKNTEDVQTPPDHWWFWTLWPKRKSIDDEVKWRTLKLLITIRAKKRFQKTKQLMMFVKMEIGQNIKESKWRTDDTPFRGFWPLLPFQAITGLKIKLFFSNPFLLFVVYNTQRHSDGCEIQYIGSSVFILLLLGVSLNVIRPISFQIPFLQVLFQLAATSMLGCPALMVSPSK